MQNRLSPTECAGNTLREAIHRQQRRSRNAVLKKDGIFLWSNAQILDGDLDPHRKAVKVLLKFRRFLGGIQNKLGYVFAKMPHRGKAAGAQLI